MRKRALGIGMAALVAAGSIGITAVEGAVLYWDANGDGTLGGTGTWSTSGVNESTSGQWTPDPSLTSNPGPYGPWDQTGGQDVAGIVFSGINQTVTISGTVSANKVEITPPAVQNPNVVITGGTLNLTGAATIDLKFVTDGPNQWITLNTSITGSNGLTTSGKGSLQLGGNNSYTGTTTLNNGRVVDLSNSGGIPAASLLNLGNTLRIMNGVHGTAAGLTGAGQLQAQAGGSARTRSMTLNRNDGTTSTYTGARSGTNASVDLIKQGNYTQIFSGSTASNNPGNLDVQGGVFALATNAANGFGGRATIGTDEVFTTITISGGQLRLDNPNQIGDDIPMVLAGGTFNLNGNSEVLGDLTVSAGSILDFGSGGSIVQFISASYAGGLLTVNNWEGDESSGGGLDQFLLAGAPDQAFLDAVTFSGHAAGAVALDAGGGLYEIVPIPEPGAMGLLGVAGLLMLRRRRR